MSTTNNTRVSEKLESYTILKSFPRWSFWQKNWLDFIENWQFWTHNKIRLNSFFCHLDDLYPSVLRLQHCHFLPKSKHFFSNWSAENTLQAGVCMILPAVWCGKVGNRHFKNILLEKKIDRLQKTSRILNIEKAWLWKSKSRRRHC